MKELSNPPAGVPLPAMADDAAGAKRTPCPSCVAGPAGIEGHDDMRAQALGASTQRFQCRKCGTPWSRLDAGAGVYRWSHVDTLSRRQTAGVFLPGRS